MDSHVAGVTVFNENAFIFRSAERRHFEVTPTTWPPDVMCKHTVVTLLLYYNYNSYILHCLVLNHLFGSLNIKRICSLVAHGNLRPQLLVVTMICQERASHPTYK